MSFRKFCLAAAFVAGILSLGQFARADLQQIISETQRMEQSNGDTRLIWYIPTDYWRESFKTSTLSAAQAADICNSLDHYIVFAVADVHMGAMGALTAVPRAKMLPKISLKIDSTDPLKPVDEDQLSPEVGNMLALLRPMMGRMLGQFGKGIEFYCFTATDESGNRRLDPTKPGVLRLNYGAGGQSYRLPLGSLLPPKYDPNTGEKFAGNYVYSPFNGSKLVDKAPTTRP